MNLRTLRTIIELFEASSAVEMELDNSTIGKLKLRRPEAGGVAPAPARLPELASVAPVAAASPSAAPAPAQTAADDPSLSQVNSPFVGTFYRSPNPDSDPFVSVGDRVKKGQTVCIIEAMKLMNELEAEVSGEVVELLVDNGTPVEFGQVLMRVKPG